jgi:hypothetical protein
MKIQIPDYVVKACTGLPLSAIASVHDVVDSPERVFVLANGDRKLEGSGIIVIGRPDSTGKFFKISKIRLDKAPKA